MVKERFATETSSEGISTDDKPEDRRTGAFDRRDGDESINEELRDGFAMAALDGLIAASNNVTLCGDSTTFVEYRDDIIGAAWAFADGMVKAR